MPYQKGAEPLSVQTNVKMSESMKKWLQAIAQKENRTMGDIVRFCIQHCIDEKWEP